MSIHRFTPPSSVSRIVFRYANDRPPVALVSAGRTNPAELWSVRRALEGMGWECVPARAEGRLGLQVQGFKDEGQLVAFLQQNHFVSAAASVTPEPGDHPSRTVAEWLEDKSMKICGWSYIIGDVSLLLSGLMSGRSKETLTGLLYTAGGAVLARYGNIKTAEHVRGVSERLGEYIQEQGATLPEECGLFSVLKEKREGMLPTIDRFLARYPSQTTISIYSLGSLTMLQSGLKHGKAWDTAYGAITGAAGIGSILVPENRTDAEGPPPADGGPMAQCWQWIQEKPLRMAGYAYIVGGLALGMSAYREYKTNPQQKSYIFKFLTTATYLVGDAMMAISSKKHTNADGTFDAEEQRGIEALAAEAIARQPQQLREGLAHHVAGFLSTQPEMRGSADDIARAILQQAAAMPRNPWAAQVSGSRDGGIQA